MCSLHGGSHVGVRVGGSEAHMDLLNALEAATDEFGRRVAAVDLGGWTGATPCSDWDVHYLTAHVVGGNRFAVLILGGMSASDAIESVMSAPQLGDDALTAWAITSVAQLDAFRGAEVLERRVDHPLGEISGRAFLEFRVFDITLHAWDLARSIGADERLDTDLVHTVLDIVEHGPVGMGFGTTALAGANGAVSPQARLLDLTGRR
jgi:uncharacterized protein (TIGR03086 family)